MMFPGFSYVMSQLIPLGRRNTRYKNPQLVAQHFFVVSLGSTFRVFDLAWSICRAAKHLLRVVESCCEKEERGSTLSNKFCLCCSFFIKLTPSKSTNQRVTFLQPVTNVFVARHVDHASWNTRNIDPKLARKHCCATSWSLLFLVFRRLKLKTFAPQTPFSIHSPHARNGEICREKMFVASACSR